MARFTISILFRNNSNIKLLNNRENSQRSRFSRVIENTNICSSVHHSPFTNRWSVKICISNHKIFQELDWNSLHCDISVKDEFVVEKSSNYVMKLLEMYSREGNN